MKIRNSNMDFPGETKNFFIFYAKITDDPKTLNYEALNPRSFLCVRNVLMLVLHFLKIWEVVLKLFLQFLTILFLTKNEVAFHGLSNLQFRVF